MKYQQLGKAFVIILIGAVLNSCGRHEKKNNITVRPEKKWITVPGNFSSQSKTVFDSTQITSFIQKYPDLAPYTAEIDSFYKKRNYAYAWFENGVLIEQADNLLNRISNLQDDGVYKSVPYQKVTDSLFYNTNINKKKPDIAIELMLTAQYFVFSKLAWNGMNSAVSKSMNWYLPRKKIDYNYYLDSLLKKPAKGAIAAEPVYRQYDLLKTFLRKYRKLDSTQKWEPIAIQRNTVKPGDSSLVIPLIKSRLFHLEDYHSDTLNNHYDSLLITAVKHFQQRHGLEATGSLNTATVTELNVPLKNRIRQILANMERSRWVPASLNGEYIAVNIPEYKLHVYRGDILLWSCNVVVGQTVHQTTIFSGQIQYVVFSPYWNVPPSIVQKEVIPAMRKDAGYLAKHQMEITGHQDGLPVVQQKPGPENSLGLVKFLFPNSYNIYLHDTPSKSLFGESARAFSHGCIRVQQPAKLANFLLKNYPGWDSVKTDRAMHAGKERYITLKNKVPVFIAYFTAFTDRKNALNFRKDIYKRDEILASMILSGKGTY